MSHDLSTPSTGSTNIWTKPMLAVIALGLVTAAVLVFLMVYVTQQTPSNPWTMMQ